MGYLSDTICSEDHILRVVEMPYGVYPPPESFSSEFGAQDYRDWIEQSNGDPLPAPLVLYIQDGGAGDSPPVQGADMSSSRRLRAIEGELRLQGALFDPDRPVQQFICAGCVATDWTDEQLYRLVSVVQESFFISQSGLSSWCACLGSAIPAQSRLRLLRILGFSDLRFSYVDEESPENTLDRLITAFKVARQVGMRKIALDLVEGEQLANGSLPRMECFLEEAMPERVRVFRCNEDRRQSYSKILLSLGYQNIGLDWFLRPDDAWIQAKNADRLYWSLLGFTDLQRPDVIGIGPGAVSSVGEFYGVNEPLWDQYELFLNRQILPVVRGIELEADDVLRREVMSMILAGSCIRVAAIEEKWGIQFNQFFVREAENLRRFEQKRWIDWRGDEIQIRVRGFRELVELCKIFDNRAQLAALVSGHSCA